MSHVSGIGYDVTKKDVRMTNGRKSRRNRQTNTIRNSNINRTESDGTKSGAI